MFFRRGRTQYALIVSSVSLFYFWVARAHEGSFDWRSPKSDQYNLLTQAFLAGSAHLLVSPRPELLALPNPRDPSTNQKYWMQDTALYNGKYYSVYGPTPVLTTYGPYRLLTGFDLPTNAAAFAYSLAGFLFSAALFFAFEAQSASQSPAWLNSLCILTLGLCQFVPAIARRPMFYEVAVLSGYCFTMAGFFFLFQLTIPAANRFSPWLALLAGTSFGFSLGCRPTLVLVPALAMVFYLVRRCPADRWRLLARSELYLLSIPVLAGYSFSAWYNYIRFGNPFDTGHAYALTLLSHMAARPQLSNLPPSLFLLLLTPLRPDLVFPFLHFSSPNIPNLPDTFFREYLAGALFATPILLCCLFFFVLRPLPRSFCQFGALLLLSSVSVLLLVASVGWVTQRYAVDFVPELLLLACWSVYFLWRRISSRSRVIAWAIPAVMVFGILIHLGMGIGGVYGSLFLEHPDAYRAFADKLTDFVNHRGAPDPTRRSLTASNISDPPWTFGVLDQAAQGDFSRQVITLDKTPESTALKVGDTLEFRSSGARGIVSIHPNQERLELQLDGYVSPVLDGWPRPILLPQ